MDAANAVVARMEDALDRMLRDDEAVAGLHRGENLGTELEEAALLRRLDRDAVAWLGGEIRRKVADRRALGLSALRDRFAPVFEAWRHRHPDDPEASKLMAAFAAHPVYDTWSELPAFVTRSPLEEAFASFVNELDLIPSAALRSCRFGALIRALVVDPDPAFDVPSCVIGEPGHWLIIDLGPPCLLYAAVAGKVFEGPLPALAAAVLLGDSDEDMTARFAVSRQNLEQVRRKLSQLGLLRDGVVRDSTRRDSG